MSMNDTAASRAPKHILGRFTSRGLADWDSALNHSGLPLSALLASSLGNVSDGGAGRAMLELGCGEGHVLLDVLGRYPKTEVVGMNSYVYGTRCLHLGGNLAGRCGNGATDPKWINGSFQVTDGQWRATAAAFGIKRLPPQWPAVVYGDYSGIRPNGQMKTPLPFPRSRFDLVLSQDALNEGKLIHPEEELPAVLEEVFRVLRSDGHAVLQVTRNDGYAPLDVHRRRATKADAVLARTSLMAGFPMSAVGLVEQRKRHGLKGPGVSRAAERPRLRPCFNTQCLLADASRDPVTVGLAGYEPIDFARSVRMSKITTEPCADLLSFIGTVRMQLNMKPDNRDALYLFMRKRPCEAATMPCTHGWKWANPHLGSQQPRPKLKAEENINKWARAIQEMVQNGTRCK